MRKTHTNCSDSEIENTRAFARFNKLIIALIRFLTLNNCTHELKIFPPYYPPHPIIIIIIINIIIIIIIINIITATNTDITMTREDKDSLVEMLAKIPITETRGSLLSAIGKLLRVIDISENSIMIPTLLKDKCEFDAYEMLTLAKILKASILGHNDLVEFYMSESSSQLNSMAIQQQQLQHHHHHHHRQHQHQHQHQHQRQSKSSYQNSNSSSSNNTNNHNTNTNNNLQLQSTSPSLRSSLSDQSTSTTSTSSPISTPSPPQAESLGSNDQLQLNNGDPDATIRLLLQIEQLKTFIPQVTGLFEGIIELYKNSVDTITCQTSRSHK